MAQGMLQPPVTWAEDRATQRCDPSADPGAKTKGRAGRRAFVVAARLSTLRDWRESDKRSRHDAATRPAGCRPTLANTERQEFQFPLNQHRGRLHVTWCWREDPDLKTNHDLMYAYSDDRGRTWQNNAGRSIGHGGQSPVNVESPGIVVAPIAFGWGMMNQLTQDVDGQGRVHVILWHNPLDAPGPNHDLNAWRYYHYWRDESGRWNGQALPFFGRKPRLVVDESGDALMVFNKGRDLEYHGHEHGGKLHVAAATAKARWTDWRVVYTSDRDFVGEPRVDLLRWRAEHLLSVYVQQKPDLPGNPSPLRLIEFEPHF